MELIALLFIAALALLFLKFFAFFFNIAIFAIALPFKILAFVLATLIGVILLVPLGLFVGLIGILIAPLAILAALIPFILIAIGLVLIFRNS